MNSDWHVISLCFASAFAVAACAVGTSAQGIPSVPPACYSLDRNAFRASFPASDFAQEAAGPLRQTITKMLVEGDPADTTSIVWRRMQDVDPIHAEWALAWIIAVPPEGTNRGFLVRTASRIYREQGLNPSVLLFAVDQGRGDLARADAISALAPHLVTGQVEEVVFSFACDASWILTRYSADSTQYKASVAPTDLFVADRVVDAALPILLPGHRNALLPLISDARKKGI